MTRSEELERAIGEWLKADASVIVPTDPLEATLAITRRQRPMSTFTARVAGWWSGESAPGRGTLWRMTRNTTLVFAILGGGAVAGAGYFAAQTVVPPSPPTPTTAPFATESVNVVSEPTAAPPAPSATLPATPSVTIRPEPSVRLAPDSPPAAPEGPCLGHATTYDRVPPTVALTTQISKAVIIGEITEVGPSRWNTADELPPAEPNEMLGTDAMRILRVHVVQAITRGAPDQDATIWIPGGEIGCHQFSVDGFPAVPTVGSRFALFLNDVVPANGVQGIYGVFQLWSLTDDGNVKTPEDGTISTIKFAMLVKGAEGTQAP